jgi:phosphoribosylformylglycinamidine synthase
VTGGNVSLYNQTGEASILPTPVVAVLGVIDDVRRRTPSHFQAADEVVLLLGTTRDELDGSEWAHVVHGHLGGLPPTVDLEAERALGALLADASRDSLVTSAHDLSEGGLAQALVEASFRHGVGVSVALSDVSEDSFVALFSESAARAIVTVTTDNLERFSTAAEAHGVPVTRLGSTGGDAIVVEGEFELPVAEARAAWSATLPDALA